MDSALKRDAIVAESAIGTTPATPAFKVLRTIGIDGSPQRANDRSPERVSNGQAKNMYQGLVTIQKTIRMPWVRDDALDILWASLFYGSFTDDVLVNGLTPAPFTLEEKYEAGATDPYRRITGCLVDSCQIQFRNDGQPGQLSFNVLGRLEATAMAAIAGATYADAAPGYDPVTASEIVANDFFGLSSPEIAMATINIANNSRAIYGWGSPNPARHGRGWFQVDGNVSAYFAAAADYSAFTTRQSAKTLDLTIGSVTDFKDQLVLPNCDVWNPSLDDPGPSGDFTLTLQFMAKFDDTLGGTLSLTRLVA